jgi:hypothetical protein
VIYFFGRGDGFGSRYVEAAYDTNDMMLIILRIFEENQNPMDMHTSIMCINILQNIKAVALKL